MTKPTKHKLNHEDPACPIKEVEQDDWADPKLQCGFCGTKDALESYLHAHQSNGEVEKAIYSQLKLLMLEGVIEEEQFNKITCKAFFTEEQREQLYFQALRNVLLEYEGEDEVINKLKNRYENTKNNLNEKSGHHKRGIEAWHRDESRGILLATQNYVDTVRCLTRLSIAEGPEKIFDGSNDILIDLFNNCETVWKQGEAIYMVIPQSAVFALNSSHQNKNIETFIPKNDYSDERFKAISKAMEECINPEDEYGIIVAWEMAQTV